MMKSLRSVHIRSFVLALSLLGLCLVVGCDSTGTTGPPPAPGTPSSRLKDLQDVKSKTEAKK